MLDSLFRCAELAGETFDISRVGLHRSPLDARDFGLAHSYTAGKLLAGEAGSPTQPSEEGPE
jgi:hypothetical protein